MTQTNIPGRSGGTIDTPVGAQWPQGSAKPGSTDFGSATVVSDLASRSETMTAQPVEDAHLQTRVEADHHGTPGGGFAAAERIRSRPSAAAILGSAVAGAVAGGAIPFMLSGRKTESSTGFAYGQAEPFATEDPQTAPSRWSRSWR
jgi:hypothetical protein